VVKTLICTKDWIRASSKGIAIFLNTACLFTHFIHYSLMTSPCGFCIFISDPKDLFSIVDDLVDFGVNVVLQEDGGKI
jgi:hypothetical protein